MELGHDVVRGRWGRGRDRRGRCTDGTVFLRWDSGEMMDRRRVLMVLSGRNRMVSVIRVPLGEQPAGHPELATCHGRLIRLNVSSE